jgi:hypothetical protein
VGNGVSCQRRRVPDHDQGLEYTMRTTVCPQRPAETTAASSCRPSAQGDAGLAYGASLMALRARQEDTGVAALDGKRVTNVPELRRRSGASMRSPPFRA